MDELIKGCQPVETLFRKEEQPEFFSALAEKLEVYDFAPGEPVYEDTDIRDDGLYVIIDGKVDISNRDGQFLFTLKKGDFFGADSLFTQKETREENAKAQTPLRAAALSTEAYEELLNADPQFSAKLANTLFHKYDADIKETETRNARKERGAKGVFFAVLLLFFTSYYSNFLAALNESSSVSLASVIVYYVGIVALIAVWFWVGKFPKREIGFGNYLTWRDTVLNLGILAELCALFFLGSMLADSNIMTGLCNTGDITGAGYFAFAVMLVIYSLIFVICTGYLPVAVENLLPGKLGGRLRYVVPALFAMVIYGSLGGAVSALWLGITVLSLTVIRIKTGNTLPVTLTFALALIIGTFGFRISYIPMVFSL